VLFDMDGVLVRTDQLKADAHSATVRQFGGDVAPSFYELYMGNSHAVVRAAFMARAGLSCAPARYTELYQGIYRSLLDAGPPVTPGVPALLEKLAERGIALALVSSSRSWMVDQVLRQTSLERFFQAVVTADDIANPKPAPDAYRFAMERLGVGATGSVAVEDSGPGIEAAAAAGVSVIGFRHSFNRTHDFSKTIAEFDSLEDTAAVLGTIESALVPLHV
jgi:HAD superfamily hydrolase (TIGR01509 family)